MSFKIKHYLFVSVLFLSTYICGGLLYYFLNHKAFDFYLADTPVVGIIMWIFFSAIFLFYIRKYGRGHWRLWSVRGRLGIGEIILIVGLLLLFIANNYLLVTFSSENLWQSLLDEYVILSVINIASSSVGEEIVYRGFIQTYINTHYVNSGSRITKGNVFATILMAGTHLGNFIMTDLFFAFSGIVVVILFSLISGYFRDKTDGIMLSILLHLLCNGSFVCIQLMH